LTRRSVGIHAAVLVTAAGFAAALTAVYVGMRDVMRTSGGFCASGGPYVIAHQCPKGATGLLIGGMLGLFVFGAAYLGALSWADGPVLAMGLVGWAALFGALGWNFLDLGVHPPAHQSGTGGWTLSGIVFWLMALGGLVPALGLAVGWLRRGGEPDPGPDYPHVPLVMAQIPDSLRRANDPR
jgi:hypothetical protein